MYVAVTIMNSNSFSRVRILKLIQKVKIFSHLATMLFRFVTALDLATCSSLAYACGSYLVFRWQNVNCYRLRWHS